MDTISVLQSDVFFDLEKLTAEVALARKIRDFSDGPYGNCISLPSEGDVDARFRCHHNNVPFSGALNECSYLRHLFDRFLTEKAAFRLLRRGPQTAYSLHDDKDKGSGVLRFQIPILTSEKAFILIPREGIDFGFVEAEAARSEADQADDIWFDLEKLERVSGGRFELFSLTPGYMYYFDTDEVHTLINADGSERVVLSLDLVMNDWLFNWMRTHLSQTVEPSTVQRTSSIEWEWNSLRFGVIRTS